MSESKPAEYRVLARKYRPQNFDELIGQQALVRTLRNAIDSGRIAHAFMLTGVRGVGKTTTARIIAKALNYAGPDGTSGPTTGPTDDCRICRAIAEDRHPDVLEMDAATRTGVDDIREILDGVRYAPSEARYKVYIIDEVHMLSKQAFNALLKTLEEPPPHVKFIFATTEIRKVPVTVLSRCQRFDLRRVDIPTLIGHFTSICEKESVNAEAAALGVIARAADGSVRDGLSLLDQAIALATGGGGAGITAAQVQDMLGLADRARTMDVLEYALTGNMPDALAMMDEWYRAGSDPVVLIQDLLDLTHILTRLRAVPKAAEETRLAMAVEEKSRAAKLASELSMPSLGKAWQILLKGIAEVQSAPNPQSAAEMVIIRLGYAADLPDPADLIKKLQREGDSAKAPAVSGVNAGQPSMENVSGRMEPAPHRLPASSSNRPALAIVQDSHAVPQQTVAIHSLESLIKALESGGEVLLASQIYQFVHLVRLEEGRFEFRPDEQAPPKLAQHLTSALKNLTGQRWVVTVSSAPGQPSLAEQAQEKLAREHANILALPDIQAFLKVFPEAELKSVTHRKDDPS